MYEHYSLIATLFTVVKTLKQSKCPSLGSWLNKLQNIHTTEYMRIAFLFLTWIDV